MAVTDLPTATDVLLDNVVWHSLRGAHRHLGEVGVRAARFDPAVSPFGALDDEPGAAAWAELSALLGPGGSTVLFRGAVRVPRSWRVAVELPGVQMVGADAEGSHARAEVEVLGPGDVPEVLELVGLTRPGPFGLRTIELGRYLGVRREGRLVAMAGERTRVRGHTEISAVCTHPAVQGQGLASRLVRALVADVHVRGEVPYLHAAASNESAIRLYRGLGFEVRRPVTAVVVVAPS
jgi:ribosomal protein S18 acetylase RimI-like enzyme